MAIELSPGKLQLMAKQAVASWSEGRHSTLNMAVANQVKLAGSMNREQMQRLVEASNQEAYRLEHTTKVGSHRIVDFKGGLARLEDVVKQATGLPEPVTYHDIQDYASPPAQTKQASWDEIMGVEGIEKKAEADPGPYSGLTLEKLSRRLEHEIKNAQSELDTASLHLPSARDELVMQMKRAHREGSSLGEIAQYLGAVDADPLFLKSAFQLAYPTLKQVGGHTDESYMASIKQAHAVGTPDFEHPLARAYLGLIDASTKVAAARSVLIELEDAQRKVAEEQAASDSQPSWKDKLKGLSKHLPDLSHLRNNTPLDPATSTPEQIEEVRSRAHRLNNGESVMEAVRNYGLLRGSGAALTDGRSALGTGLDIAASVAPAALRHYRRSKEIDAGEKATDNPQTGAGRIAGSVLTGLWAGGLETGGAGRIAGSVLTGLWDGGLATGGANYASGALGKRRAELQKQIQKALLAQKIRQISGPPVPEIDVSVPEEPFKVASGQAAASGFKSVIGGFRRVGDAVSHHAGEFGKGLAGEGSVPHRIGQHLGKVVQYTPHAVGALGAYRAYQHASAAMDSPIARTIKGFIPFTDENQQKDMQIRNFYGAPMYGQMPGYPQGQGY